MSSCELFYLCIFGHAVICPVVGQLEHPGRKMATYSVHSFLSRFASLYSILTISPEDIKVSEPSGRNIRFSCSLRFSL